MGLASEIVERYLQNHAEPFVRELSGALSQLKHLQWQHGLVVPALDERPDFLRSLAEAAFWRERVAAIIVVNQPADLDMVTPRNQTLLAWFSARPLVFEFGFLKVYEAGHGSHWWVIDACTALAPSRVNGVGEARKLGCDLAVALFARGLLESPWLGCTDADAELPSDYFSCARPSSAVAAVFDFDHVHPDPDHPVLAATAIYESAIRYYAKSLAWAGSRYAFIALGSALSFHIKSYCHVRGFPKKSGGEDFYLLNKLAKLGEIAPLRPVVRVRARTSERVPFGTGPATRAILDTLAAGHAFHCYHPEIFRCLQLFLRRKSDAWQHPQLLEGLPECVQTALGELKVTTLINHLQQQVRTEAQARKAFDDWFDGFRTLKFVHHLQRLEFPAQPLAYCLERAVYL